MIDSVPGTDLQSSDVVPEGCSRPRSLDRLTRMVAGYHDLVTTWLQGGCTGSRGSSHPPTSPLPNIR
jgi:hypothetical protein